MFARKRFDIDASTLLRGIGLCLWAPERTRAETKIASAWEWPDSVVACSSVRSAFDLLLSCVPWKPGAEVLMSAVTVPHMAVLVRRHGFVPVPVDIDPETLNVSVADIKFAISERTVAVVTAHLFGARNDVDELATFTRSRGLMLIEDCAQCFDGRRRSIGVSDVELYSFGAIKTATCLGGAVALIADRTLREKVRAKQSEFPAQKRFDYFMKLLKYCFLVSVSGPRAFRVFSWLLQRLTGDFDRALRHLTRSYPETQLIQNLRQKPSLPLLGLLAHRLHSYDSSRVDARRAAGERMLVTTRALGHKGAVHTHWLFPVVTAEPNQLVARLRAAGFDATQGASTLVALDPSARRAHEAMQRVVYLPVYSNIPDGKLDELAQLVEEVKALLPDPLPASGARERFQ